MNGVTGCKCKKSKCLKMYCECFAAGLLCNEGCRCQECNNDNAHLDIRKQAIDDTLRKNPKAFEPKIGHDVSGKKAGSKHNRGCRCKKSNCLKRYCECFQASVKCSSSCRCADCHNMEEGTPSTLPKTPDKAAAKLRAPPAKTAWAPNPTPNPNQSAIPPAMPPSSLVSNVTPNEVASNTLPVPNPISPGIGLSMLSPTIFSPGPAFNTSSPTLMGLSSKLASASHFSLEPDIFQDLQQVGNDLMMQTPGRAKPQVALTPTRFTSTYTLESPMMISFGGTPQHGTPTWALKESPSKYSRLTSPLRNRESPNGKGAKDPIADWTLSPLDTCRFLVSPGLGSDAMFNMSPAPGRGRRRITPLKRKLEDESGEPSSSGNHLLLPAADTPDVPNAAFGTDTTTKREPLQREREQATMWRSLPTIVQMRLEASPCLADLALGTAKLRDFKGIKDGACDKEGVLALAEVLFGGRERLETMALSDSRGESMTGDMKCRVLEWEGLPLRSEKESAAHKYSMLLERLKAHAMRGAIYRLLGVSAGVTSDMCLATFLTSPYKVTFDALRESPQFQ